MKNSTTGKQPPSASRYRTVRKREPISSDMMRQVRAACNNRCIYCGAIYSQFHYDHIYPHSLGGLDEPENLVFACAPCNIAKGKRILHGQTYDEMIRAFQLERVPGGPYPRIATIYFRSARKLSSSIENISKQTPTHNQRQRSGSNEKYNVSGFEFFIVVTGVIAFMLVVLAIISAK